MFAGQSRYVLLDWPCEPSILSLFHLGRDRIDPIAHILEQDALYIGGGSMRNMLAIWREHGIDEAMRTAWHRGVVLAGLSAGAMCWFEGGVSLSGGQPEVVHGIGLLPGSLSVHLDGEAERLPVYERAVGTGKLPPGHAADDGAAMIYRGTRLAECVASRAGARVVRIEADGSGGALRRLEPVRLLPRARRRRRGTADPRALRRLGAARAAGRTPPLGLTYPCWGWLALPPPTPRAPPAPALRGSSSRRVCR